MVCSFKSGYASVSSSEGFLNTSTRSSMWSFVQVLAASATRLLSTNVATTTLTLSVLVSVGTTLAIAVAITALTLKLTTTRATSFVFLMLICLFIFGFLRVGVLLLEDQ